MNRRKMFPWILITILLFVIGGCGIVQTGGEESGGKDRIDIQGAITEIKVLSYTDTSVDDRPPSGNPDDPVSSEDNKDTDIQPNADIKGQMMVEGKPANNQMYDKAWVSVTRDTQIFDQEGNKKKFAEVQLGDVVQVTFTGPVRESYPVQSTAGKIIIIKHNP